MTSTVRVASSSMDSHLLQGPEAPREGRLVITKCSRMKMQLYSQFVMWFTVKSSESISQERQQLEDMIESHKKALEHAENMIAKFKKPEGKDKLLLGLYIISLIQSEVSIIIYSYTSA